MEGEPERKILRHQHQQYWNKIKHSMKATKFINIQLDEIKNNCDFILVPWYEIQHLPNVTRSKLNKI